MPVHPGRTVKEPLLRAIVRDARLRAEEFIELLLSHARLEARDFSNEACQN